MVTGTDVEESLMTEGELCTTLEIEPRAMGTDDKCVTEP